MKYFAIVLLLTGCSGLMKDDASTAVLTVTCTIFCRVVYYENALSLERVQSREPVAPLKKP